MKAKGLVRTTNRHGTRIIFYQSAKGASKIRLHSPENTPEFWQEYQNAIKGAVASVPMTQATGVGVKTVVPNSLRWLFGRHMASPYYLSLEPKNRLKRSRYLERVCNSKHPETGRKRGDLAFASMEKVNVVAIRDDFAVSAGYAAADVIVTAIRVCYSWAMDAGLTKTNPASGVARIWDDADGFYTWTPADMEAFEKRHPIGTKARLAYSLMLYAGVRPSDCYRIGPQHNRDGALRFTEFKGSHSKVLGKYRPKPKARILSVPSQLAAVIAATPLETPRRNNVATLLYVLNAWGEPYTETAFYKQFKTWCKLAGVAHCSAHGIRKGGATEIAEAGGTAHDLMGMYGWSRLAQAERYTKKADRVKLANRAQGLLPGPQHNALVDHTYTQADGRRERKSLRASPRKGGK